MSNKEVMSNRARSLRAKSTDAENFLWYFLRNRGLNGYKFRRQQVMGPYIVDFICEKRKIIVELDGSQHMASENYDRTRSLFLQNQGYQVVRFWSDAIFYHTEEVLRVILAALEG